MLRRLLALICPVITFILELLPFGATLRFANFAGIQEVKHYSYFDMTTYGYGNIGPVITGYLTLAVLILAIIFFVTGSKLSVKIASAVCCLGAVFSFFPILFDPKGYTVIGIIISVLLILQCVYLFYKIKH